MGGSHPVILDHDALGDLQLNRGAVDLCLSKNLLHTIRKVCLRELSIGYVDAHLCWRFDLTPLLHLPAGRFKGVPPQRHNYTRFLCRVYEELGVERPPRSVPPSQECLEPDDALVSQADNGLIAQRELRGFDPASQLGMKAESLEGLLLHLGFEDLIISRTLCLGPVHGDVCIAEYQVGFLVRLVAEGNADAR